MKDTISSPLISVVMPCLNGERDIQAAIDSVLAQQTFNDIELIVVDNGAADRTPEILGSVNERRPRLFTLADQGVSLAHNFRAAGSMWRKMLQPIRPPSK